MKIKMLVLVNNLYYYAVSDIDVDFAYVVNHRSYYADGLERTGEIIPDELDPVHPFFCDTEGSRIMVICIGGDDMMLYQQFSNGSWVELTSRPNLHYEQLTSISTLDIPSRRLPQVNSAIIKILQTLRDKPLTNDIYDEILSQLEPAVTFIEFYTTLLKQLYHL